MRKHLLLAMSLASVLMLAGCSCGTGSCNTPTVIVAPAAAQPAWEYVTASAKDATTMTAEEYQALLASGKIREVGSAGAAVEIAEVKPVVTEAAPVVVAKAPVKKTVVAPVAAVKQASGVPQIPAMPLPEGWNYIHEKDLSGGALNKIAVDQYYTRMSKPASRFDIEDI